MINNIEKIYSDIESVRGSSDRVTVGLRYNYYSYLNILDLKKKQLERKLEELSGSGATSYDEIKKVTEIRLVELKLLLHKIRQLIK